MYLLTRLKIYPDLTLLQLQRGVINYFDTQTGSKLEDTWIYNSIEFSQSGES